MTKLLFNLHNVPDDEINDVRELFDTDDFETYETDKGRWGIGLSAIWLRNDDQFENAKALLNEYQQRRYEDAQIERSEIEKLSFTQGLLVKLKQDPEQFFMSLLALTIVLGVTIYPFIL
jgi:hypothetical protein